MVTACVAQRWCSVRRAADQGLWWSVCARAIDLWLRRAAPTSPAVVASTGDGTASPWVGGRFLGSTGWPSSDASPVLLGRFLNSCDAPPRPRASFAGAFEPPTSRTRARTATMIAVGTGGNLRECHAKRSLTEAAPGVRDWWPITPSPAPSSGVDGGFSESSGAHRRHPGVELQRLLRQNVKNSCDLYRPVRWPAAGAPTSTTIDRTPAGCPLRGDRLLACLMREAVDRRACRRTIHRAGGVWGESEKGRASLCELGVPLRHSLFAVRR